VAESKADTEGFLEACRARNVGFFVLARKNTQVEAAIFDAIGIEEVWLPSLGQDGKAKDGSSVVELTSLIDHANLPAGTRLIARRKPLHLGVQRSLFPSMDFRCWGVYNDQDGEPRELDVTMRAHAHVESRIQRLKDSGLCRFPLTSFEANTNWLTAVSWPPTSCAGSTYPASTGPGGMLGLRHCGGDLPRSGTTRPSSTPANRTHHRQLADPPGAPRRLPTHRSDHLTTAGTP